TRHPSASSRSTRWLPMNPAPPVTMTVFDKALTTPSWPARSGVLRRHLGWSGAPFRRPVSRRRESAHARRQPRAPVQPSSVENAQTGIEAQQTDRAEHPTPEVRGGVRDHGGSHSSLSRVYCPTNWHVGTDAPIHAERRRIIARRLENQPSARGGSVHGDVGPSIAVVIGRDRRVSAFAP